MSVLTRSRAKFWRFNACTCSYLKHILTEQGNSLKPEEDGVLPPTNGEVSTEVGYPCGSLPVPRIRTIV